ncbi:hypothetical protein RRG08_040117 [Elysia crispata]|uniref:Uncharacterized protein n=1 Tax=Elysia crispata TaxID=231223 RepID=A0AAE0XW80_9GAST|nr:hypothetical protein RRG08_040117 [Elysia crispata]
MKIVVVLRKAWGMGYCGRDMLCLRFKEPLPIKTSASIVPGRFGTCQKYKLEGENCNSFDKMNGYCSCGPGLYCHTHQVPLSTLQPMPSLPTVATHMLAVSKRRMAPPQDGYQWVSKCEKIIV